jgi:hypothetical protein
MASREPDLFPSQGRSNVPGRRTFFLEVTYGTTSVASAWGKDLALIDGSSGTTLTVVFPRTYRKLTGFRWGWKLLAHSGVVYFPAITDGGAIATDAGGGVAKLVVETRTEAGVATAPVSGSVLLLEFDVSMDVLTDGYAITPTTS